MARLRNNGGVVGPAVTINASSASGLFHIIEANQYIALGTFPRFLGNNDNYFPYTTLLLHADGTNGANNSVFLDSSSTYVPFSGTYSNYFNGSSYLTGTISAPGAGNFTMECWVYFNSFLATTTPFSMLAGSSTSGFEVWASATQWGIRNNLSNFITYSGSAPQTNTWYHVAIVRNFGTITLYVNGVSVGSTATAYTTTDTNLSIGSWLGNGSTFVTGYVSNVRLVNGQALYTGAFTPPTSAMTATSIGTSGVNVASSITGTVAVLTCQSASIVDNGPANISLSTTGTVGISAGGNPITRQ